MDDLKYRFFCDFDGTVTKEDVIDRILEEFADPAWREIEQSWVIGDIGSRDCLATQTRLIKAKKKDLFEFVEGIAIDETFIDFAIYCKNKNIKIAVLSDGVDLFIKSILNRWGLKDIEVFSNGLAHTNGHFEMTFPYFRKDCSSQSGICKCRVMEELSSPEEINVLVGDGRSDFCVASRAYLTFAKSTLLDFCGSEKIPYIEYREFGDITRWLRNQARQDSAAAQGT
jgi:2,3-diketo-5-methylthio-1-phosphopentane phosphatase